MTSRQQQREHTRRAILEALAQVIAESGVLGFSVQEVADRAGVTHRTVYNHFPTRQALNDALAVHVEERAASLLGSDRAPDADLRLGSLESMAGEAYEAFEALGPDLHASVLLMLATGAESQVTRDRTVRVARLLEDELGASPSSARLGAAALRMFLSSTGWHLLTQNLGLSPDEAVCTATWATKALLDDLARGNHPGLDGSLHGQD